MFVVVFKISCFKLLVFEYNFCNLSIFNFRKSFGFFIVFLVGLFMYFLLGVFVCLRLGLVKELDFKKDFFRFLFELDKILLLRSFFLVFRFNLFWVRSWSEGWGKENSGFFFIVGIMFCCFFVLRVRVFFSFWIFRVYLYFSFCNRFFFIVISFVECFFGFDIGELFNFIILFGWGRKMINILYCYDFINNCW